MSDLLARIDALTDEVLDEARARKVDALIESCAPGVTGVRIGSFRCDCDPAEKCHAHRYRTLDPFEPLCDTESRADLDALRWQAEHLGPDFPVAVNFATGGKATARTGDLLHDAERWAS